MEYVIKICSSQNSSDGSRPDDQVTKENVHCYSANSTFRYVQHLSKVFFLTTKEAFLINLRATYFPPSQGEGESIQLLPNAVATPSCTKKGKGMYVLCQKETIDRLVTGKGDFQPAVRAV